MNRNINTTYCQITECLVLFFIYSKIFSNYGISICFFNAVIRDIMDILKNWLFNLKDNKFLFNYLRD